MPSASAFLEELEAKPSASAFLDSLEGSEPAKASLSSGFDTSLNLPELRGLDDIAIGGLEGSEAMQLDQQTGKMVPILRALPVGIKQKLQLDTQGVDPYAIPNDWETGAAILPPPDDYIYDPAKSEAWNRAQVRSEQEAMRAGLPSSRPSESDAGGSRKRLIDALNRAEQRAGRRVKRFTGEPGEPTGDRVAAMDLEQLVTALREAEEKTQDARQRQEIAREREYWEKELSRAMTAEQWKAATGLNDPSYDPSTLDYLHQAMASYGTGAARSVAGTLEAAGYLSDIDALYDLGQKIRTNAEKTEVVHPDLEKTRRYSGMAGQLTADVVGAGKYGKLLRALGTGEKAARYGGAAVQFGGQGVASGVESAREVGATDEQTMQRALAGGAIGAATGPLGATPRWLSRLSRYTGEGAIRKGVDALVDGGMEAGQELAQMLSEAYADKKILDKDRELYAELVEGMRDGGIMGAAASLVFSALGGKNAAAQAEQPPRAQQTDSPESTTRSRSGSKTISEASLFPLEVSREVPIALAENQRPQSETTDRYAESQRRSDLTGLLDRGDRQREDESSGGVESRHAGTTPAGTRSSKHSAGSVEYDPASGSSAPPAQPSSFGRSRLSESEAQRLRVNPNPTTARQAESDEPEFTAEEWDAFLDEELERRIQERNTDPTEAATRGDRLRAEEQIVARPDDVSRSQLTESEAQRLRVSPEEFSAASASSRQAPEIQPAEAGAQFSRQETTKVWRGENFGSDPVPAVRTTNGTIYADPQGRIHSQVIESAGIAPESVNDGGWIVNGEYREANSHAQGIGERARAAARVRERRANREDLQLSAQSLPDAGNTRSLSFREERSRPLGEYAKASISLQRAQPDQAAQTSVSLASQSAREVARENQSPFSYRENTGTASTYKLKAPSNQTDIDPNTRTSLSRTVDPWTGKRYSISDDTRAAFAPVENAGARMAVQAAERKLGGKVKIQTVALARNAHPRDRATLAAVSRLARRKGFEVVYVRSDQPLGVNGWHFNRRIFLNVDSVADPLHVVAGHEVAHGIQQSDPVMYRAVKRAIKADAALYRRYRQSAIAKGYDSSEVSDEFVADVFGEAMEDPVILHRSLGSSLARRVLARIQRWLDQAIKYLRGQNRGPESGSASAAVTNLEEVRERVVAAMRNPKSQNETPASDRSRSSKEGEVFAPVSILEERRSDSNPTQTRVEASRLQSEAEAHNRARLKTETSSDLPYREPNNQRFQRQQGGDAQSAQPSIPKVNRAAASNPLAARKELLRRLIDENIDDLLSGKLTKADLIAMANQRRRVTSTKNAQTAKERESRGIAAAKEVAEREFPEVWQEMQAKVANNPGDAKAFYDLLKLKPDRAVNDLENALLLQHQITLQTEFDRAVQRLGNAKTDEQQEEAGAVLDHLRDELQSMYDVLEKAGTATARGLNARRMLAAHDFTLARMEATVRAKANKGKPLDAKQQGRVKDVHKRIATAEERLLRYEKRIANLPKNRSLATSAKAARERLRARIGRQASPAGVQFARQQYSPDNDYAIVGAELIDNGAIDFTGWSAQMRKELGNVPDIKRVFAASQDLHREYVAEALARDKKRLGGLISKWGGKAARRDFSKPPKRPVRMDPEKVELLRELESAKKAYNNLLALEIRKNRTPLRKAVGGIGDLIALTRSIKSSGDISAPGRQGLLTVLSHPIISRHAFKAQFKALVSEKAYERQQIELQNRANWKNGWYKSADLGFRDANETSLSKQDEIIAGRWSKYVPGVNASARAYTAFLNRLIADVFDAMVAGAGPRNTPELRKIIANNINIQTGRAPFGRYEPAMVLLNQVYFAPKLTISRFQYLLGMPLWQAVASQNPYAMRVVATEYVRSMMGLSALYTLLLLMQDDDDPLLGLDPTDKSTFLTVRVGDSRIDFAAGLKQAASFGSQFIWKEKVTRKGERKSLATGKWGDDDIGDVLAKFNRSKLHPAIGAAYSAHKEFDFVGRPTSWTREMIGLPMPMPIPTTYEIMKEHDLQRGVMLSIMAALGGGVQTYSDDKKSKEDPTLEDEIMEWVGLDRPQKKR